MIHFDKTNTPIKIYDGDVKVGEITRVKWSTTEYEVRVNGLIKTFPKLLNAKFFALSYLTGAYHAEAN